MTYEEVEKDIERLENSDFTMDDIYEIPKIIKKLGKAAYNEMPPEVRVLTPPLDNYRYHPIGKKIDEHIESVLKRIRDVVSNKLREKLDISDELIDAMTSEITCEDNSFKIVKMFLIDNKLVRTIYNYRGLYSVGTYGSKFYSRHDARFHHEGYVGVTKDDKIKFINSLNKIVRTLPIVIPDNKDVFYLNDNSIDEHSTPYYIYFGFDHLLSEIVNDKTGNLVTNFIVTVCDDLAVYCFKVRYINGNFEFEPNNEAVVDIKDLLNKEKQKKK